MVRRQNSLWDCVAFQRSSNKSMTLFAAGASVRAIDDDETIVHPAPLLAQFQPAVLLLEIRCPLSIRWLDISGQDPNAHLQLFVT
jgi:hypothetical protein